ncbi:hypothetical protein PSPO01_14799 [Paraphaeosphaeria sporulosa]
MSWHNRLSSPKRQPQAFFALFFCRIALS